MAIDNWQFRKWPPRWASKAFGAVVGAIVTVVLTVLLLIAALVGAIVLCVVYGLWLPYVLCRLFVLKGQGDERQNPEVDL